MNGNIYILDIINYKTNPLLLILVFGRYLDHSKFDLDDSRAVAIVEKRITYL